MNKSKSKRPAKPKPTPEQRAIEIARRRARRILNQYSKSKALMALHASHDAKTLPISEAIPIIIADLIHLADENSWHFRTMLAGAVARHNRQWCNARKSAASMGE